MGTISQWFTNTYFAHHASVHLSLAGSGTVGINQMCINNAFNFGFYLICTTSFFSWRQIWIFNHVFILVQLEKPKYLFKDWLDQDICFVWDEILERNINIMQAETMDSLSEWKQTKSLPHSSNEQILIFYTFFTSYYSSVKCAWLQHNLLRFKALRSWPRSVVFCNKYQWLTYENRLLARK